MNLQGAKFKEIIGIINYIASESEPEDWRRITTNIIVCDGLISGTNLRLRHIYHDKGLQGVSLTGKGWMLSFQVTKQRPRSMPEDVPSEMAEVVLAPYDALKTVNRTAAIRNMGNPKPKLCFHSVGIASPEEFRTQMTILRMFSSEWEL